MCQITVVCCICTEVSCVPNITIQNFMNLKTVILVFLIMSGCHVGTELWETECLPLPSLQALIQTDHLIWLSKSFKNMAVLVLEVDFAYWKHKFKVVMCIIKLCICLSHCFNSGVNTVAAPFYLFCQIKESKGGGSR